MLADVEAKFPHLDFKAIKHDPYPAKAGPFAFSESAVHIRGQTVLRDLYHRPEKVIAVVSHSAFLRIGISKAKFANADYRIFDIVQVVSPGDQRSFGFRERPGVARYAWFERWGKSESYDVKQWDETEQKGGGMGLSKKGRFENEPKDFVPHEEYASYSKEASAA